MTLDNKKIKTIGVLGGMGPDASAYFCMQLVRLSQTVYGAAQDTDYPPILHHSIPLTGFDETGITDSGAVLSQLIASAQGLVRAGADFIVIPCNTVHIFQDAIRAAISVPLISIIECTVLAIQNAGYATVGIISSDTTRQSKLYEAPIRNAGITPVTVGGLEDQAILNDIILHVMSGTQSEHDDKQIATIAEHMRAEGAEALVLGCTELPLAVNVHAKKTMPLLDSIDILARAALAHAFGSN